MAGATAYATAKAGLDGLIAALKWETGERDVLISIVSPGFTVTENNLARFTDEVRESVRRRTPSRRLSVPGDIAAAVLMLGSLANGNITGRVPSGRRRDRLTLPRRRVRGPVGVPRAWGSGPDARFRAGERATPSR